MNLCLKILLSVIFFAQKKAKKQLYRETSKFAPSQTKKFQFAPSLNEKCARKNPILLANSYFRYKCEKVILSLWWTFAPEQSDGKITFSLVYRTLFFDTTCEKLDLGHAFLLERVQNRALRTECEKIVLRTRIDKSCYTFYL